MSRANALLTDALIDAARADGSPAAANGMKTGLENSKIDESER